LTIQQVEEGRFACAIGPDNAQSFTDCDLKREAVYGFKPTKIFR